MFNVCAEGVRVGVAMQMDQMELTEIEISRANRIQQNLARLAELGIPPLVAELRSTPHQPRKPRHKRARISVEPRAPLARAAKAAAAASLCESTTPSPPPRRRVMAATDNMSAAMTKHGIPAELREALEAVGMKPCHFVVGDCATAEAVETKMHDLFPDLKAEDNITIAYALHRCSTPLPALAWTH